MEVHDCYDGNHARRDSEQDAEGKCLREAATHVTFDNRKQEWSDLDPVEGILNGRQETLAQVFLLHLVPCGRIDHLDFRFGMESDGFHYTAAYAFVKTSSALRSSTRP